MRRIAFPFLLALAGVVVFAAWPGRGRAHPRGGLGVAGDARRPDGGALSDSMISDRGGVSAGREGHGRAGGVARSPLAGAAVRPLGSGRQGASIAGLTFIVLGAAAQFAWIGLLAWVVVEVLR
jgi:hypothetical protein